MKNSADNASLLEEVVRLDEHQVLRSFGYRADAIKSDKYEIFDLTTPSVKQITEALAVTELPYPITNIVFASDSEALESESQLAIKHGVSLQSLVGTHLGQRIRKRAIDVIEKQDATERSKFISDVKAACHVITVFEMLQVIKSSPNWKRQLTETRRYEWNEPLKEVIDRLTPVISGRRKVGGLSDEEKAYILLYLKHITEFFKLDDANPSSDMPEPAIIER